MDSERHSKDILAELYRSMLLPNQYTDLQHFFKDFQALEQAYFLKVPRGYELWSKFSLEKMVDGATRIAKSCEAKKELQIKQMELEVARLQTLIEMKGES